jgi:DNA repair exonuclease SbcCD nuclease subunit
MFKILHCADFHLDGSFAAGDLPTTVGTWRRADLKTTLERIFALARERLVDAITIAGDLYEQDYVLPDTVEFLKQQFAALAPIRIFITPGEHDPYAHNSLYALTRWSANVTIFTQNQLTPIELAPGLYLWGAAHPPERGREAILDGFKVDRKGVNLLLLHAADAANPPPGRVSTYLVDPKAVAQAGFDLALLGHQHAGRLWPLETPRCLYPGSPEPLTLADAGGAHTATLITVDQNRCAPVELIPVNQWRYLSLEVDLTGCETTLEAARRVETALKPTDAGKDQRLICYVTLTGQLGFDLDRESLYNQVKAKAFIHYQTRFSISYDLQELAQEPTVRGLLVRSLQTRLEPITDSEERCVTLNALNLALRALDEKREKFYEIG